MKRILIGVALLGGIMFAPTLAGATNDIELSYPPNDESIHLKTTICHWANGNLSEPSVSLNAVDDPQDTGHGMLTLTATGSLGSFEPHEDPPGHEQDAIIDIYVKHGNDILYLYQANTLCNPLLEAFVCFEGEISVLTDEDQAALNLKVAAFLELNVGAIQVLDRTAECEVPVATTTTTTAPPVVTTTTTAPPVIDTTPPSPPRTAEPVSVELLPTQPVAAPTNQLPHTGLGDWLWITGAALLLSGIMMSLVGRRIPA